jgi:hypothetical protein
LTPDHLSICHIEYKNTPSRNTYLFAFSETLQGVLKPLRRVVTPEGLQTLSGRFAFGVALEKYLKTMPTTTLPPEVKTTTTTTTVAVAPQLTTTPPPPPSLPLPREQVIQKTIASAKKQANESDTHPMVPMAPTSQLYTIPNVDEFVRMTPTESDILAIRQVLDNPAPPRCTDNNPMTIHNTIKTQCIEKRTATDATADVFVNLFASFSGIKPK